MNKDIRIKEKFNFFLSENIRVHVELNNKTFLNGILTANPRENVYTLNEDKLGEVFVFVGDVYDVDKFKEKEE